MYEFPRGENQAGGVLSRKWLSIIIDEERMFNKKINKDT
tara:strand:+ start:423 stop:539 length:117 start_codon:yes stop_codon:yes gene_type:complete